MTYWCEVRPCQRRLGRPQFVALDQLGPEHQGFRSVYAYPAEVRVLIETRGSTAGLAGTTVYSDVLLVDFDDADPSDMLVWLWDEQLDHRVYTTGNRGCHIHVSLEPMLGPDVPYSQRDWVRANVPGADCTFYHHAGQFRLPGTRHEKTGRHKQEVQGVRSGRLLEIPMRQVPSVAPGVVGSRANGSFHQHLLRSQSPGGRRQFAWHLAVLAVAEGLSFEVALRCILWWNSKYCKPSLPETVIAERCHEAYAPRGRRHAKATVGKDAKRLLGERR